jgi:hypothetical protein
LSRTNDHDLGGEKCSIIDNSGIKTRTTRRSKNIWDLYDENTIEG